MSTALFLIALVVAAAPPTAAERGNALTFVAEGSQLQTPSYAKLKGRRLAKFKKSKGASELNEFVRVEIAGKDLLKTLDFLPKSKTWLSFRSDGVVFYVRAADPYFEQTKRRLQKNSKLKVVVKGQVRTLRMDEKRIAALKTHSLQAIGRIKRAAR